MPKKAKTKTLTRKKTPKVESVLQNVGRSARTKAFRKGRPVAISMDGITYLEYADGQQVRVTQRLLQQLRNG